MSIKLSDKKTPVANHAVSVLKKLFTGSLIILIVGVCAYASLFLLMCLI